MQDEIAGERSLGGMLAGPGSGRAAPSRSWAGSPGGGA